MEKVSIIVPVYKCEKYIDQCISSILSQDYKNIELILILDGVFDNSDVICKKYACCDKRVIIIEKENEGVSVARNVGLKKATGKWVCFIDGDDWIEPNYISHLAYKADLTKSDIYICGYYTEYENCSIKSSFFKYGEHEFKENEKRQLITSCIVNTQISNEAAITNVGVPWAKIYSNEFLKNSGIEFVPGLARMQDMIFNLYAFSLARKIYCDSEPLYHYLKNETSSTVGYRPHYIDTVFNIDYQLKKFIEESKATYLSEARNCKTVLLLNEAIKLQYAHVENKNTLLKKREELFKAIKCSEFEDNLNACKGLYLSFTQKISLCMLKNNLFIIIILYKKLQAKLEQRKYR